MYVYICVTLHQTNVFRDLSAMEMPRLISRSVVHAVVICHTCAVCLDEHVWTQLPAKQGLS